jgi:uncharacterized membrane protein
MGIKLLVLLAATVFIGLDAGVCGLYAHTIMPGLATTDDRTFIGAFQAMDRAIINPVFMTTFFGALLLAIVAIVLCRHDGSVLPWVIGASVLYAVTVVITMVVNVPLNDGIEAAGDPAHIANLAAVRAAFNESLWVAWNLVRTITATAAFICLAWALVLSGRAGHGA